MLCASAVCVFENASPARSAPSAMSLRASRSSGCAFTRPRPCISSRAACTARPRVTGFAWTFQMLSSACDNASRPLASVGCIGRPTIRRGSTITVSGKRSGRDSDSLRALCGSQTVAHRVTSLPVPAVVGIATIGSAGRTGASPVVPAAPDRMRSTRSKSPCSAASTFAESITEPPPSAISTSGLADSAASRSHARRSIGTDGFASTQSIRASAGPSCASTRSASRANTASGYVTIA
ncbi:hypothetical protein TQ36_22005 [Burkholderia cenocepacia]|nr:hypothetical protein TQ36_22005 [Burkholderia cenocepacia]